MGNRGSYKTKTRLEVLLHQGGVHIVKSGANSEGKTTPMQFMQEDNIGEVATKKFLPKIDGKRRFYPTKY